VEFTIPRSSRDYRAVSPPGLSASTTRWLLGVNSIREQAADAVRRTNTSSEKTAKPKFWTSLMVQPMSGICNSPCRPGTSR
jgi:hypothetical protein